MFYTRDLTLATYIFATGRLQLTKVESPTGRFCEFQFADPQRQGDRIQRDFEAGAEASAIRLFESLKRLRQLMDAAKKPLN